MLIRTFAAAAILTAGLATPATPVRPPQSEVVAMKAPAVQPQAAWRTNHRAMIEIGAELL